MTRENLSDLQKLRKGAAVSFLSLLCRSFQNTRSQITASFITTLCNRPSETRPSGFFSSPSQNLVSPAPDEIFDFSRPVYGFPGAALHNQHISFFCVFEKRKTATRQKSANRWKNCRPVNVFFVNPVRIQMPLGLLLRGVTIQSLLDKTAIFEKFSRNN